MFLRLVLAGVLYGHLCIAQIKPEKLLEQSDELAQKHPANLIYLQVDKGIYEQGEDIWFKAYIMDSRHFEPALQDTTLYLSLISADSKEIILQDKIRISGGFATGHLFVINTIPSGDYMLGAFTGSSFFKGEGEFKNFRKIKIKNTGRPATTTPSPKKPARTIAFFPEGGNLVEGLTNNVAFRIEGEYSEAKDKILLLEDGALLQTLEPMHQGMGKFQFTPKPAGKYTVEFDNQQWPLPEIMKEGIVLRLLSHSGRYISLSAAKTKGVPFENILISAQVRGVVYAMYEANLKNDSLFINLPANKFPPGIVEITLYNEALDPLAERLVFANNEQRLTIETQLSEASFETKNKVRLTIKVSDLNGDPVSANLGLSVYDSFYKNPEDRMDIVSYSHLYSQIRGKIKDPDYYFNPANAHRLRDLDLLLSTQGWRKYVWSIAELKKSVSHYAVLDEGLRGRLERKKNLPPSLLVFTPDETDLLNPIPVSQDGRFQLSTENMSMGEYFYFKPLGLQEVDPRQKVKMDDPFKTIDTLLHSKSMHYPDFSTARPSAGPDLATPGRINLNEVVIRARGKSFSDKYLSRLDSMAQWLNPDYACTQGNILNCDNCGHGVKPVEGEIYQKRIIPNKNQYIQIIYKRPNYTEEELMSMFNIYRVKGYQRPREFYQPDYELNPQEKAVDDDRKTLIWNPFIITNENGEAVIEFYCSDVTGKFIGKIEGIDEDGLLGASEFSFMVTAPAAK